MQRESDGATAWLEEDVSKVVRLLYAAETAPAEGVVDNIGRAIDQLRGILVRLQGMVTAGDVDEITAHVAKTLAVLYPVRAELERAVAGAPSETRPKLSEAPIPLTRRREPERRGTERARVLADVGFQSDSNFFTGFSSDVSDGGLFVATYDVLPVGTELMVSFVLPEGHQITVTGRVSWIRDAGPDGETRPGMGIAFDGLTTRDHAAIQRFMTKRTPLFHES